MSRRRESATGGREQDIGHFKSNDLGRTRIFIPSGTAMAGLDANYPVEFDQVFISYAEPGYCRIQIENMEGQLTGWIPIKTGQNIFAEGKQIWLDFSPYQDAWNDVDYFVTPARLILPVEIFLINKGNNPPQHWEDKACKSYQVPLLTEAIAVVAGADSETVLSARIWIPYRHNRVGLHMTAPTVAVVNDEIRYRWIDPMAGTLQVHPEVLTMRTGEAFTLCDEISLHPGHYQISYYSALGGNLNIEQIFLLSYAG